MSDVDAAPRTRPGSRSPLTAAVLTVAVLAAGCLSGRGGDEVSRPGFDDYPVRVQVENQNWSTVHVYVVAGGQIQSLGQLSSQNTETWEVPAGMLGGRKDIRLMADPIGSRESFLSDPILIEPGDLVEWTLTQPLAHSSVMVR